MPTAFETYIASIEKDLKGGKATEHTYRSALETLMESQARGIAASNDPKHIECGAPEFIQAMEEKLGMRFQTSEVSETSEVSGKTFSPEDVFHYAYAVFHNPTYRTRYAEFLKIDFPRLPLTSDKKLFAKLVELGKELVELHLLKSSKVEDFITAFPVAGNNKVEKVVFGRPDRSPKDLSGLGRVWINPAQYFDGVPEDVWEFQVGGYQVCEKWLKDRRERVLSGEEINHYQKVVVALKETIRLMKEIDKAVVKWPME